jgi:hypothetical protein
MTRLSWRVNFAKAENCRNPMTSSRARRETLAETLDKKWSELRGHSSIERDSAKMLRLTAELEEHRQQPTVVTRHSDDC